MMNIEIQFMDGTAIQLKVNTTKDIKKYFSKTPNMDSNALNCFLLRVILILLNLK